jgi:arylsulfatase A-like enzyme
MRKLDNWLILLGLALGSVGGCALPAPRPAGRGYQVPPQNVVLIGWDGAQRNHVKELLAKGQLPNLQQLSNEGALVAIDIFRTTDTKAGWAQILTGYEPEVTGVFSNSRYKPIAPGYTIFERLEQHFGPENFVTVAVIGKKAHVGAAAPKKVPLEQDSTTARRRQDPNRTASAVSNSAKRQSDAAPDKPAGKQTTSAPRQPAGKIIEENGKKYRLIPGEPFYHASLNVNVFINGLVEDEKVARQALKLLDEYRDKPFFFFVHFAEVDQNGHQFGENSPQYEQALVSADGWTGEIIRQLKHLGLYEKTLIYVTADHGFDEGRKGHGDAPYVFLATNDRGVIRRGGRADIAPTILKRFGLDLAAIDPPLDGQALTEPYSPQKW